MASNVGAPGQDQPKLVAGVSMQHDLKEIGIVITGVSPNPLSFSPYVARQWKFDKDDGDESFLKIIATMVDFPKTIDELNIGENILDQTNYNFRGSTNGKIRKINNVGIRFDNPHASEISTDENGSYILSDPANNFKLVGSSNGESQQATARLEQCQSDSFHALSMAFFTAITPTLAKHQGKIEFIN